MRTLLGILVLVVGVGVLGYWAHGNNAARIEQNITGLAATAASGTIHTVATDVSGRDIHVSGIADSEEEKQQILAALDAVEGRRVVTEDLRVLERVTPFTLDVLKDGPDAALTASGYVSRESVREELGLGEAAGSLELASGAPDGWADLAKAGIAAMDHLQSGQMLLSDNQLTITGIALGPDQRDAISAALAGLPDGAVTSDITLLDDGTPAAWQLNYDAFDGATIAGKLPRGLELSAIAETLGLSSIAGDPAVALFGEEGNAGFLGVFRDWMGRLERLSVDTTPEGSTVSADVQTEEDAAELRDAVAASGVDASVEIGVPQGANGDTRVNAASGQSERFMGGYWLALPEGGTDVAACQAASDSVLERLTVNFVTGSDRLDAGAVRAINELARFMIRCAEEAGLTAEIGGHTDNVGDEQANLELSQRRAEVVRDQLAARGVPADALVARGYGMTQPIADNETEEGRARNRRTSIVWSS